MKRRSLGQHYLVDERVADLMVSAAELDGSQSVLEIGTGRGVLTKKLGPLCARLEGYEVDPENFDATLRAAAGGNLRMHLEDAFRRRPPFDVLVSSLPYSRSAEFVEWLCQAKYARAVVLLQEDFVRKIVSRPGARAYRAVSVLAQLSSDIRLGGRVGREAFSPRPRVDSRMVVFRPKTRLTRGEMVAVKRLFALRRRTVSAALKGSSTQWREPGKRVYQLAPDEVYDIVRGA